MKKGLLGVLGTLIAIAGIIWTLQGLGFLKGSVMSGKTMWAVIGPLVAVAGLAMILAALRGRSGPAR